MPVSYNTSRLLKCSVGMAYTRYFISGKPLRPLDESTGTLTQGEIDIFSNQSPLEVAKRNSKISGLVNNNLGVPLDFAST